MKKVFLDVGHGGKDPGAVGINGLREKDINLSVSELVGKTLKKHNVEVFYSRTTDVFINLTERSRMANKLGVDVFVSIHGNKVDNEQAQGLETFSHPLSKNGAVLARCIQDSILKDKLYTKDRGIKTANFSVLRNTKMTAALVELGFLSNKEDSQILINKQYELAKSAAKGILNFLGIKYIEKVEEKTESNKLYKVQVGAYSVRDNAERLLKNLESKGFKGYIKEEGVEKAISKLNNNYYKKGTTEVIELDPMDLKISVEDKPGNKIKLNNFVTSGFQWHHSNGVTYPLGILASENRGISNRQPHNKPAGTLLVYRNGTVKVKDILNLNDESMVRFAVSGCSILPEIKMNSAGFVGSYSDVGRKTSRPMAGYRKKDNKIIIAVDNCTIEEGKRIMQELGCNEAITLDAGGSTVLKVDNKMLKSTARRLYSIITW